MRILRVQTVGQLHVEVSSFDRQLKSIYLNCAKDTEDLQPGLPKGYTKFKILITK